MRCMATQLSTCTCTFTRDIWMTSFRAGRLIRRPSANQFTGRAKSTFSGRDYGRSWVCERRCTLALLAVMDSSISTRNLSLLGSLSHVERVSQSIAVLDAILSPEWEYRFFSFNAAWDLANHERMASMRDGS